MECRNVPRNNVNVGIWYENYKLGDSRTLGCKLLFTVCDSSFMALTKKQVKFVKAMQ